MVVSSPLQGAGVLVPAPGAPSDLGNPVQSLGKTLSTADQRALTRGFLLQCPLQGKKRGKLGQVRDFVFRFYSIFVAQRMVSGIITVHSEDQKSLAVGG